MASIALKQISKSFGETRVLKNVDLDIHAGEFLTLVGPSGCGKSTLLRILAGLEAPNDGSIEIAGKHMNTVRASERNLAMVFQSYALYPHLTVAENMMTPLKLRDLSLLERAPVVGPIMAREKYRTLMGQVEATAKVLEDRRACSSASPASSPAASASGPLSGAPWCASPWRSSWTSPCRTWTPSCAFTCAPSWFSCTNPSASRSFT